MRPPPRGAEDSVIPALVYGTGEVKSIVLAVVNAITNKAGGMADEMFEVGERFFDIVGAFYGVGGASRESFPP